MPSGSPNINLTTDQKVGEAGHGVRISLYMLALGWDFLPGEGIFESFFTRRVPIDNGTGPLVDIL